jgi:hypothetical protein
MAAQSQLRESPLSALSYLSRVESDYANQTFYGRAGATPKLEEIDANQNTREES